MCRSFVSYFFEIFCNVKLMFMTLEVMIIMNYFTSTSSSTFSSTFSLLSYLNCLINYISDYRDTHKTQKTQQFNF